MGMEAFSLFLGATAWRDRNTGCFRLLTGSDRAGEHFPRRHSVVAMAHRENVVHKERMQKIPLALA